MSYEESHIKPCVQTMVDVRYTGLYGAFWQARAVSMYWIPFWRVADFDRHPVMKRHVISSTKHVFKAKVVKPSHLRGVRVKKSAISLIYLCPCDVQKVDVLPFCCVCLRSLLMELSSCFGKARQQSAARDVIWKMLNRTWKFHNGGRECARRGKIQTKPSQMVLSIAVRVLFDSDGNGKSSRLKYIFLIFRR